MNIIQHFYHNDHLQRSLVKQDGTTYMRVAATFSAFYGETEFCYPAKWLWNDAGAFRDVPPSSASLFEALFVAELIRLNAPAPAAPEHLTCQDCKCTGPDVEHTFCPYAADVHDDPEHAITVCSDCKQQRAEDI